MPRKQAAPVAPVQFELSFADPGVGGDSVEAIVPLRQIRPAPDNVRSSIGDVTALAQSVASEGLLQPLVVHAVEPDADGRSFEVIAGHRRLAALELLGDPDMRVRLIVRPAVEDDVRLELMIIENLHREELSPIDQARGFHILSTRFGHSQADIARRTGVSQPTISRRLLLVQLPEKAQEMIASGKLALGDAEELTKIKDAKRVEKVLAGGDHQRSYLIRNELDNEKNAKKRDAAKKRLAADGTPVLGRFDWAQHASWHEGDKAKCIGAVVDTYGNVTYVKAKPKQKAPGAAKETKKQREAREAREAEIAERDAEKNAAIAARRAFAKGLLEPGSKVSRTGASEFVALVLLDRMTVEEMDSIDGDVVLELLDLEVTEDDRLLFADRYQADAGSLAYGVESDVDVALRRYAGAGGPHIQRAALAVAMTTAETMLAPFVSWKREEWLAQIPTAYLDFLGAHGWAPSAWETAQLEAAANEAIAQAAADAGAIRSCRSCGCTEANACDDGCIWVDVVEGEGDLCSACAAAEGVVDVPLGEAGAEALGGPEATIPDEPEFDVDVEAPLASEPAVPGTDEAPIHRAACPAGGVCGDCGLAADDEVHYELDGWPSSTSLADVLDPPAADVEQPELAEVASS